mmetsp:Transcript_25491/g.53853  ORF Transcript_25491/g.53853 Transcript_25491/m.53853 type:complete len:86 (-) Transcript_25491:157-414(-)
MSVIKHFMLNFPLMCASVGKSLYQISLRQACLYTGSILANIHAVHGSGVQRFVDGLLHCQSANTWMTKSEILSSLILISLANDLF